MGITYRCEGGVVAWKIGDQINNRITDLICAVENNWNILLLTKSEMQMMAAADLGPQWKALADSPVRFTTGQIAELCGGKG